jgi:hypothetical protein
MQYPLWRSIFGYFVVVALDASVDRHHPSTRDGLMHQPDAVPGRSLIASVKS